MTKTHLDWPWCCRHDQKGWHPDPRRHDQSRGWLCWDFQNRVAWWRFASIWAAVDQSTPCWLDVRFPRWLFSERQVSMLITQCQLWIKKRKLNMSDWNRFTFTQWKWGKRKFLESIILVEARNWRRQEKKLIKGDDQSVSLFFLLQISHSLSLITIYTIKPPKVFSRFFFEWTNRFCSFFLSKALSQSN